MREIKFRAWDGNTMFDVAQITFNKGSWSISEGRGVSIEYQPHITLMQFTGLKDKNGKEIYEGDIVRCVTKGNINWPHQGTVEYLGQGEDFCCGYFAINVGENIDGDVEYTHFWNNKDFEIIGNIYENLELIKETYDNHLKKLQNG